MTMHAAKLSCIGAAADGPWPQWLLVRDGQPISGWACDDLASKYKKISEDKSESAGKREAATLFCTAEKHLNGDENAEAALETAKKALELFSDKEAIADTHRLVTYAMRANAHAMAFSKEFGWLEDYKDEMNEALEYLEEEQGKLDSEDEYGKGVLLLTVGEITYELNEGKEDKQADAMAKVKEAILIFRVKVFSKQMEAIAKLALSSMCTRKGDAEGGETNATQAMECFQDIDDKVNEAKATHFVAIANAAAYHLKDGLELAFKALNLFRDLELHKHEALVLYTIAKWNLARERPREAISAAKEAQVLIEENKVGKNWEIAALRAVVEANIAKGEAENGVKAAETALSKFRKQKADRWKIALTLDTLAHARLANGKGEAAVQASDESWAAIADDPEADIYSEAIILRTWCQLLLRLGQDMEVYNEALQGFKNASDRYKQLKDPLEQGGCELIISDITQLMNKGKDSLKAANNALTIFKTLDNSVAQGAAHLGIARAQRFLKDFEKAEEAAEEARVIFNKEEAFPALVASAHAEIALIKEAKGEMKEAVRSQKKAYILLKQTELVKSAAESLLALAKMHDAAGEYQDAYRVSSDARESAQKGGDRFGELQALLLVTSAASRVLQGYAGHGKSRNFLTVMAKAMQAAREATSLCDKLGEETSKAVILFREAQLSFLGGKATDALRLTKEALPHFVTINDKAAQGQVKVLMAQVCKHNNDKEEAKKLAQEGLELLTEVNDTSGAEVARSVLKSLGVFQQAGPMLGMPGMMGMPRMGTRMEKRMVKKRVKKNKGGGAITTFTIDVARPLVNEHLKQVIANDEDQLSFDIPLMDMGLDSLGAVSFRNDLNKATGLDLPASLMFDYPTSGAIAEMLVEQQKEKLGDADDGGDEWEEIEVEEMVEVPYEIPAGDMSMMMQMMMGMQGGAGMAAPTAAAEGDAGGASSAAAVALAPVVPTLSVKEIKAKVVKASLEVVADGSDNINGDMALMDAGIDSLAAVSLRNDLSKEFGVQLPAAMIFDYPTINDLSEHIYTLAIEGEGDGD